MMKIPIMSYAINLTFWLLVWLVPGEKFYGLGTGFQFQTIPVPLYVLNPMGLLCIPHFDIAFEVANFGTGDGTFVLLL